MNTHRNVLANGCLLLGFLLSQTPGKGAKYMVAFTDGEGTPLSGGVDSRINLPAHIPAANFWSLTLYEAENGSGLAHGQAFPSLGSRDARPDVEAGRHRANSVTLA